MADSQKDSGVFYLYYAVGNKTVNLKYAGGNTLFLAPLTGYGVPNVQAGATRKARLYVVYSHRMGSESALPVIRFQGGSTVDFHLPGISGGYDALGAGWSDFHTFSEFSNMGHATISAFANGWDTYQRYDPVGSIARVDVVFYDEFPQ